MATKKTTAYGVYSGDDLSQFFGGGTSSTKKKEQNNGLLTNEVMQDYLDNKNKQRESFERGRQLVEAQRARDAQAEAKNAHTASELDLAHGILPATSNAQAFANQHGRSSLDDAVDQIAGNNVLSQQGKVNRIGEEVQNRFGNQTEPVINDKYDLSRAIRSDISQNRQTNTAINNAIGRYAERQDRQKRIEEAQRVGKQGIIDALTQEEKRLRDEQQRRQADRNNDPARKKLLDERGELVDRLYYINRDLEADAFHTGLFPELEAEKAEVEKRIAEYDRQLDFAGQEEEDSRLAAQIAQNSLLLDKAVGARYTALQGASDFKEKSKYKWDRPDDDFSNRINGLKPDEFGDINSENFDVGKAAEYNYKQNTSGDTEDYLDQFTNEERDTYNYILNTAGTDEARKYVEFLRPELEKRATDAAAGKAYEYAHDNAFNAILSAGASIIASPLRAMGTFGAIADAVQGKDISPNAYYNRPSTLIGAAREGVNKQLEENVTGLLRHWGASDETAKAVGSKAAWLNQGVLSSLDSAWNAFLGQQLVGSLGMDVQGAREILDTAKLGLNVDAATLANAERVMNFAENTTRIIMSAEVVPDAIRNAKERGYTDDQAMAVGLVSGFAEWFSEAYSIGNLFETDWTKQGVKNFLINQLKQRGFEGLEEIESNVIDTFADALIAKDKSEWQEAVDKYTKELGKDRAVGAALLEKAGESLSDFMSAFLTTGNEVFIEAGKQYAYNKAMRGTHESVSDADRKKGTRYQQSIDASIQAAMNKPEEAWASDLADAVNGMRGAYNGNTVNRTIDYLREAARTATDGISAANYTAMAEYLSKNKKAVWQLAEERNGTAKQTTQNVRNTQTETAPEQTAPSTETAEPSSEPSTAEAAPSTESTTEPSTATETETEPVRQATARERREEARRQKRIAQIQNQLDRNPNASVDAQTMALQEELRTLQEESEKFADSLEGYEGDYEAEERTEPLSWAERHRQLRHSDQTANQQTQTEQAVSVEQQTAPETQTLTQAQAAPQNVSQTSENAPVVENGIETENNTVAKNEAQRGSTEATEGSSQNEPGYRPSERRIGASALSLSEDLSPEDAAVEILKRIGRNTRDVTSLMQRGVTKTAIDALNRTVDNAIQNGQYTAEEADALKSYTDKVRDALRNNNTTLQKKVNALSYGLKRLGIENVVVDETMTTERGKHKGNTIYISPYLDTMQSIASVVAHEAFHQARDGNRKNAKLLDDIDKYYSALASRAQDEVDDEGNVRTDANGNPIQFSISDTGGKVRLYSDADFVRTYADMLMDDFGLTDEGYEALNAYGAEHKDADIKEAVAAVFESDPEKFWSYWKESADGETAHDYIREEKAANFIEQLAGTDGGALFSELVRDDRNLAQRIIDAIRSFLKLLAKERRFEGAEAYQRLADKFEKALADATGAEQQRADMRAATANDIPQSDSFKMARTVERVGDLVAIHNLTEGKYLQTHKLGGFPAPSIAIVKAKTGHSEYGPISVVLAADAIDPQKDARNRIFAGDAWTPMFPQVEYNYDQTLVQNLDGAIYRLASSDSVTDKHLAKKGGIVSLFNDVSRMSDNLNTVLDYLSLKRDVQAAYIVANGGTVRSTGTAVYAELDKKAPDDKVRKWITPIVEKIASDAMVDVGDERVPLTAENVVRAMYNNQGSRGVDIYEADSNGLRSMAAPEYQSLDEVRQNADKLKHVDTLDYQDTVRRLDGYIRSVIDDIREFNKDRPVDYDKAILDALREGGTEEDIRYTFEEAGIGINDKLVRDIGVLYRLASQLPTDYFEAKPERVVGFDEVMYYIVPDQTSEEVVRMMKADGAKVRTYAEGNEKDRLKVLNSLKDARFSREMGDIEQRVEDGEAISAVDEVRASRELDEKYMEKAVDVNRRTDEDKTEQFVDDAVMEQAGKDRATIKAALEEAAKKVHLPEDITGNTYIANGSYNGTEENTTICIRSLALDALCDAVAEKIGRPLTVEESVFVSQSAFNWTQMPQCMYCYVSMDRMAKRQYLLAYIEKRNQVIADLRSGMTRDEAFAAYKKREQPKGKWKDDGPKTDRFNRWVDNYENKARVVTMSDLASERAAERALADPVIHDEAYDALDYAQNASWAKKRIGYTAYNNHILNWKQDRIDALNSMFGLRMYSFSDYSPAFVLENMQMITDAAVRGLKMLAYTKDLDFVKIFAPTGMNINISVFSMNQRDADGNFAEDAMQGANWKQAQALRDQYPGVGITYVATNDEQVEWALDQDWIDVIIPFHMVRTGAEVAGIMGYNNYTGESSDRTKKGNKKAEILPNEHQNDKETYMNLIRERNLKPRFSRWQNHPNYMKLVNETRRSAGETPSVQPVFEVGEAEKSIAKMVRQGGYNVPIGGSLERMNQIAQKIGGEIEKGFAENISIKDGIIYQNGQAIHTDMELPDTEEDDVRESREINTEQTETEAFMNWFGDWQSDPENASKVVNEDGSPKIVYHGTPNGGFTVFDSGRIGDNTNRTVSDVGFYFTNDPFIAKSYQNRRGDSQNGETKAVYLDIKKPLVVEGEGWGDAVSQTDLRHNDIKRWLEEGDYDGVIVRSTDEIIDVDDHEEPDTVYIVRNPAQIKSATDNIGTFDQNNPDIRYSREITPEQDAEYMEAVESGDTEKQQQMVDDAAKEAGYTVRKWHQTNVPNIHVFDLGIGTHGGTDSETPYGVFTKSTNRDIGLGNVQMQLLLKAGKTFTINNREELRNKMPEAYKLLAQELEAVDAKYESLAQEAEDALFEAQDAYEEKHPDVEISIEDIVNNRTYDDPDCQKANERWKAVMAEWREEADKIRVRAKGVLTDYLKANNYDSMEIKLDRGANGRSTDTFIVLSPEQVKSADPVTYDNDGNPIPLSERFNPENEDIRHSREVSTEQDQEYMDAVESGDEEEQQRIIDEVAEQSFSDSKIRDEDGKLLGVYHGTDQEFTVFDPSKGRANMDIQGSFFSPWELDAEGYGSNVRRYYLNITNPAPESVGYRALNRFKGQNQAGVKARNYLISLGYDGVNNGDEEYIAFYPEQIKSADPITYDDDGNVIPPSQRFNPERDDIRESRDIETASNADLRRMLRESEEKIDYLKKQWTARTAFGAAQAVRPEDFNKQVRRLKDMMKYSVVTTDEIRKGLRELYDIMERPLKGRNDTAEARWNEAAAKAEELANEWASAAALERVINPDIADNIETFKDIYGKLRNYSGFYVVPEMTAEAGDKESFRRLRKQLSFMHLLGVDSNKAGVESGRMSIDAIYTDLARSYPGFFEEQSELSGGELNGDYAKLQAIADVAGLAWEAAHDPYSVEQTLDEQTVKTQLKDDLLHSFFDVAVLTKASSRPTENDAREAYAQGQAELGAVAESEREEGYREGYNKAKFEDEGAVEAAHMREDLMEQRFAEDAERFQNTMRKMLNEREEKINRLEKRLVKRGWMDRARVERNGVMRNLSKLNRLLENPTRKQHIPQGLRASTAKLLESVGNTRLPNGKTVLTDRMQQIQADEMKKMRDFAHEIQIGLTGAASAENSNRIASTEGFLLQLADKINALEDYYNRAVGPDVDMSLRTDDVAVTQNYGFLHSLNQILTMAVHALDEANQFTIQGKNYTAENLGALLVGDLNSRESEGYGRQKRKFGTNLSDRLRNMTYETMSADLFFGMMGDNWKNIVAHSYREGQNRQAQHEHQFIEYMKELLGDYDNMNAKRELIQINANGKPLNVTRSQLMQLYATYQRPAGRTHLENGGACFVDDRGNESRAYTVKITPEKFAELTSHLTEEDKRIADGLVKFMADECSEWGNDASMYMYGFRMYEDGSYIPLDVVNYAIPEEIADNIKKTKSIENASFTNPLKRNSTVPLRMTDIFDITNNHVRRMAAYNAYAPITNDMNRIMKLSDVSGTVQEKMGRRGYKYLQDFVQTVAANEVRNGEMAESAAPLTTAMNLYKRQAVAWNVSTMLKQPISIFRAANEIDGKYLRQGFAMNRDEYQRIRDTMLANSGVAYLKDNGYSDVGLGKTMEKLYTKDYINDSGLLRSSLADSKLGRAAITAYDWMTDKGMAGAGRADEATWVRIWKACELEVAEKHPGITADEKLRLVTQRFNDVIGKTQVVDTILDTAPLMRNKAMQIFTPFMNEPTKSLGGLVAAADAVRNGRTGAKKALRKAVGLYALSNLLIEPLITSLVSMWRDEKDDTDGFLWSLLEKMFGIKRDEYGDGKNDTTFGSVFTSNVVQGIFSFPLINIAYDTISNAIQGFGSEKIDVAALSNLVSSSFALASNMAKEPDERPKTMYRLWGDWIESAAAAMGIPLKTMRRQVAGTLRGVMDITNSDWAKWQYNKLYYNLENGTARSQKNFYDILASAYKRGDTETYERMRKELNDIVTGSSTLVDSKTIVQNIERRGGNVQPGDPLWNVEVQARFRLDTPVKGWKNENFLTGVYKQAEAAGIKDEECKKVLYSMPDNETKDEDGEKIKMTPAQYDQFTSDCGDLAYKLVSQLSSASNAKAWSALTIDQQLYAIEKVYDYSKRKFRKDINPNLDISGMGKDLAAVYETAPMDTSKIVSTVMAMAKKYDKKKDRKKK